MFKLGLPYEAGRATRNQSDKLGTEETYTRSSRSSGPYASFANLHTYADSLTLVFGESSPASCLSDRSPSVISLRISSVPYKVHPHRPRSTDVDRNPPKLSWPSDRISLPTSGCKTGFTTIDSVGVGSRGRIGMGSMTRGRSDGYGRD